MKSVRWHCALRAKYYGVGIPVAAFDEFNADCAASCTITDCSCTRQDSYWTSTTHANNPAEAYIVGFNGPGTVPAGKTGGFAPVRAVRNVS